MLAETKITWEALQALIEDSERGVAVPTEAREALGDEIVRCEVLQGGGLYRQLLCLRLFDQAEGWEGWNSMESWMGVKLGLTYKTANERLRVARSLGRLPRIDEAFREGRLSYTKVRAIHDVATPANEETLLDQARWASGEQLRRLVAPLRAAVKRSKSSQAAREQERRISFCEHPTEDLVEIRATVLPEEAAAVRKALEVALELELKRRRSTPKADADSGTTDAGTTDSGTTDAGTTDAGTTDAATTDSGAELVLDSAAAEQVLEVDASAGLVTRAGAGVDSAAADQRRERFTFVDALVFVAESFLAQPPRAGVPAGRRELIIHTYPDPGNGSAGDLGSGLLETGDSLSAEAVQRLACDGATVRVHHGPRGEVLDLGRRTRRIGRTLGRALEVRDPCCRFPGCPRRAMLDAHHLTAWSQGGKTNLHNLLRLCRTHHRHVHEGGWTVRRNAEGEIEFLDPRGRTVERPGVLPQVDARAAHAALLAECQARGLEAEPEQLTALEGGEAVEDWDYATSVVAACCGFESSPEHRESA